MTIHDFQPSEMTAAAMWAMAQFDYDLSRTVHAVTIGDGRIRDFWDDGSGAVPVHAGLAELLTALETATGFPPVAALMAARA